MGGCDRGFSFFFGVFGGEGGELGDMSFVLPMGFFLVGGVCSGVAQEERRDTGVGQSVVVGTIARAAFGKPFGH